MVGLGSTLRIGDGRKVKIRGDSWLPEGKVISPQKSLPLNARVCALMDEEGPRPLGDRISVEFLPHEAESILSLPLSNRCIPDKLIWQGTTQGNYATSCAYKLLLAKEASLQPGTSNPAAHSVFWNNIWSLKVPAKVKHFIWRACNEYLPTKKNLFRRCITKNATCDICNSELESLED